MAIRDKHERYAALDAARREIARPLLRRGLPGPRRRGRRGLRVGQEEDCASCVLDTGRRIDGRAASDIRPITCEVGVLPRAPRLGAVHPRRDPGAGRRHARHQPRRAAHRHAASATSTKRFMLHYNFPPFSTGEVKPLRGASAPRDRPRLPRRARARAGAARLRGLPVHDPRRLRDPRVERLVVDGVGVRRLARADGRAACRSRRRSPASRWASSRRASASPSCPTSSATRITSATWTSRSAAPRRASPRSRWTSRSQGLTREILETALEQASDGRLHILGKMAEALAAPRDELSQYAPRITRSRSSRTRSATSSARAARPSAASSSRPASPSTSRTTAR